MEWECAYSDDVGVCISTSFEEVAATVETGDSGDGEGDAERALLKALPVAC